MKRIQYVKISKKDGNRILKPVDITATKWGSMVLVDNDDSTEYRLQRVGANPRQVITTTRIAGKTMLIWQGTSIIELPSTQNRLTNQNGDEWLIIKL